MKLISLLGIAFILFLAFLLSDNRKKINYKMVISGIILEVILILAILKIPVVEGFFELIGDGVNALFQFTTEGTKFLFGNLLNAGNENIGFIFALQILPTIIFISAIMSLLYYYGIMQKVVKVLGIAFKKLLGTSGAETMTAVANMFVGQTEAPLFVKPYIEKMTKSEVFTMMVSGLGSIAVGALAGYAALGIPAKHLIIASVISAPASIIISKIIIPEVETSKTAGSVEVSSEKEFKTAIEAFSAGTSQGLMLALNVGAMLLTFIAGIALVNSVLGFIGGLFGFSALNLSWILGRLFAPIAWIIGIPASDVIFAGDLLGQKIVLNEFIAYIKLSEVFNSLPERTGIILTYALCGFANIASIGIQIAGIGGIAPNKKTQLGELGIKALIAGTLVTLFNAALIGIII
jgi:CNT family concentrative nucleoside transporter